jgi:hypothetical protein
VLGQIARAAVFTFMSKGQNARTSRVNAVLSIASLFLLNMVCVIEAAYLIGWQIEGAIWLSRTSIFLVMLGLLACAIFLVRRVATLPTSFGNVESDPLKQLWRRYSIGSVSLFALSTVLILLRFKSS